MVLSSLSLLHPVMTLSQDVPKRAEESLISEQPAPEREPATSMLRATGLSLRPEAEDAQVSPTLPSNPPSTSETASGAAAVPPVSAAPPLRGSPIAGDTALMRVADNAANAIARPTYTPSFLTGLASPSPFPGRGGVHVGALSLDASLTLGVFAEKDSSVNNGDNTGWQAVFRASPSVSGTLGYPESERFLTFDYAASLQLGGRDAQDGALDHALSIDAHYGFAKLKLQAGADYSFSTGVDRDVGSSTDRSLFGLSLDASCALSMKSILQGAIAYSRSDYSEGISSEQLQGSLFFDRQATLKTRLGLGATVGALNVDSGENQTFEQLQLRITYLPTPKLTFSTTAGYEFRQIGEEYTVTPTFSSDLSYRVRPTTTLQLSATRAVSNSAIQPDSNYTSTTVTFAVSQSVGQRVHASLALGYQYASYNDTADSRNEFAGREDQYVFVRPTITWRVTENLSLSLLYSFGNNHSSVRPFQTQQLGLSGTLSF